MSNKIQQLIKKSEHPEFIKEVFEFAKKAYGNEKRSTGELFIDHVTSVALILDTMGLDATTVAAGILHDAANPSVSTDRKKTLLDIEKKFGKEIADIVAKNSELNKLYYSFSDRAKQERFLNKEKSENIIKMFFAIAQDVRVIFIELAARIDGMKNLADLPDDRRQSYATETLEIFSPLANRLGLGEIKRALEDSAFEFLYPEKFTWLKEHIKEKYEERQKYLKYFIPHFKKVLKHEKLQFVSVDYRAKSYWSTYKKLVRLNMDLDRLYDLVALRLIVKDVATCYRALGVIHKHFAPLSGQIQDYIAKPKENGYKSLHTTVFLESQRHSEIQIKTEAMHKEAEYGICAHWAYKEKISLHKNKEHLQWSVIIPELLKHFKIDFFENKVFAFTPKGDVISLPKGATAVDFAYAVHSDVGNHCEAAKISGKIIPLSRQLKNGDVVEIITSKKKNPSYDWLKFVKTGIAKSNIRKLAAVIVNPIFAVPTFIKKQILKIPDKVKLENGLKIPRVYVAGQKDILVHIAKCCAPQPGDHAKAYLSQYRAAVVHKISCPNFQQLSQHAPEKVVDATWHQS